MTVSLRDYLWKNRWRFTQHEFARRVGIAPTYLSRIANGAITPSMTLAKKIQQETNGEVKWHELMEYCSNIQEAKLEKSK